MTKTTLFSSLLAATFLFSLGTANASGRSGKKKPRRDRDANKVGKKVGQDKGHAAPTINKTAFKGAIRRSATREGNLSGGTGPRQVLVKGQPQAFKTGTVKVRDITRGAFGFSTQEAGQVNNVLEAAALRDTHNPALRNRVSTLVKRAVQRAGTRRYGTMTHIAEGLSVADAIHAGKIKVTVQTIDKQHKITFKRGSRTVIIQTNYTPKEWLAFTRPGFSFRD